MTEVDQMVPFYLMTRRMINLVRLVLDFILATVNAEKRRHATLPYGMFLTRLFIKAQLLLDGHKANTNGPTTTMKTFSALRLKPQAQEKKKEKENKKKKDTAVATADVPSTNKTKFKPLKEGKKKKKRKEKSPSPIPEERGKSKRKVMRLAKESSSCSRAEDEVSAIAVEPINMADIISTPATLPASRATRPAQKGIIIKEPTL